MRRKFSKEFKDKVRDDYENTDMYVKEICEKHNINRQSLYGWVNKYNWKRQVDLKFQSLDNLSVSDIKAKVLYENTDMGITEIAKSENIHAGRLFNLKKKYKWRKKLGCKTRHKEISKLMLDNIKKDYEGNELSCKEISEKYNISLPTLFRWRKENNWNKREQPVVNKKV